MAEELSPESKLYVKDEIEKVSKEFKKDLEEARSRSTKTFTTVALIVGLIAGLGIIGSVKYFISSTTMAELEDEAEQLHRNIVKYEGEAKDTISSKVIIGMIVPYGGEIEEKTRGPTEIEKGWLFCNGASLNRKEYDKLYDVIGKAFGAPNPDTFNLPDLRGRFLRGVDHGTKRDPDANVRKPSNEEGYDGDKVGSVQEDEFRSHNHVYEDRMNACTQQNNPKPGAGGATWENRTTELRGGNETRPKNVYVNWIIKAK